MNCQQFAKKIIKIGITVLEISYFEKEKPSKFFDFWIFKAFFRPLRTQMAPNFRFCALFAISDNKQRVWYITRGIYPAFLENRIFFTPFCTIASFYKISHRAKTSGCRKKLMWFSALESKTTYAPMFFSSFWGQKSILRWK